MLYPRFSSLLERNFFLSLGGDTLSPQLNSGNSFPHPWG
jgi:hypothetical protein